MESVEASQQKSKLLFAALTEPELDFLAQPREYSTKVYDMSGVLLGVVKPDEMIVWKCEACTKKFASKQSLERHHSRFPICKNWKESEGLVVSEPVNQWASNVIADAISGDDPRTCRFCKTQFSSIGNFHKHFASTVACNRLAYKAVKEAFATA